MDSALMSRNREIVLPTASIATLLLSLVRVYKRAFNNELVPKDLSQATAESVVAAIWEEVVTSRLLWMGSSISADSAIERAFPGILLHSNGNRAQSIFGQIIEPIFDQCHDIVGMYMSEKSWHMWTIKPLSSGTHVLEEGSDFRIYEWERMVRESEISYPHIVLTEHSDNEVQNALGAIGYKKINAAAVPRRMIQRILDKAAQQYG